MLFRSIDPNSTEDQDLINRDFPTFNYDVIDGIEYEVDVTKEPKYDKTGKVINENTSRIYNLTYNGKPLDLEQEFLVATNNYRAGGNSFPWQGRQEIVYNSTDETRDVLKNYIEEAGKYEPTVDNNWKFKSVDLKGKVFFTSNEKGINYLEDYPAISTEKEVAGTELYKYYYDLSYEETPEMPEEPGDSNDKEDIEKPETPEEPGDSNDKEDIEKPEMPEKPGDSNDKEDIEKPEIPGNSDNNNSTPQTGDASILGYAGMAIVAAGGLFVARKRK